MLLLDDRGGASPEASFFTRVCNAFTENEIRGTHAPLISFSRSYRGVWKSILFSLVGSNEGIQDTMVDCERLK